MSKMTVSYNNADGGFRLDDAIRQAMNRRPGAETASGQDTETHMRHISYAFEDEGDDSAALADLAEILGDHFEEITYTGKPQVPTDTVRLIDLNQHKRDAHEVFNRYCNRLGWGFATQADVLVNWFGEGMIEPLLRCIQDAGQADDFEEFLADNFRDDALREGRLPGRRASDRAR